MNKNKYIIIGALILSSTALSGCSGLKSSLGLEKNAPDEFAVMKRAPLELPQTLTLPPPMRGKARPQEQSTIDQAKEALLGKSQKNTSAPSSAEDMLLQRAGSNDIDPDIRSKLDKETAKLQNRNKPIAKRLLNLGSSNIRSSATVVDAKKELERIKKNREENKSITYGETPTLEE